MGTLVRLSQTQKYDRWMMLPDIFPGAEPGKLVMTGVSLRHRPLHTVDEVRLTVIHFIELLITAVDGQPAAGVIKYKRKNIPGSKDSDLSMIGLCGIEVLQHIDVLVVDGQVWADKSIGVPCEDLIIPRIGYFVEVLHINLVVEDAITIETSFPYKDIPEKRHQPASAQLRGGIPIEFPRQGRISHIRFIVYQQGIGPVEDLLPSDPVDRDDKKML